MNHHDFLSSHTFFSSLYLGMCWSYELGFFGVSLLFETLEGGLHVCLHLAIAEERQCR